MIFLHISLTMVSQLSLWWILNLLFIVVICMAYEVNKQMKFLGEKKGGMRRRGNAILKASKVNE